MKTATIVILFIISLLILIFVYSMIYLNRENQNTYTLAIKVFTPLLISLTLLMWDTLSNQIKAKKSFTVTGIYSLQDGFPINLGGVYYNVFSEGNCYSALTTTYRATNFKEKIEEYWEKQHPHEQDTIVNGIQIYKKSKENIFKDSQLGTYSLELVAISIMHNFLKRLYLNEWEVSGKKIKSFGGGGGGMTTKNQKDAETNSTFIKIGTVMKDLNISFIDKVKDSGFFIPKTGRYEQIKKSGDYQYGDIIITYKSKYIKEYSIKISFKEYGKLKHGRFVEALKKNIEVDDLRAYYYHFTLSYDTFWYNKWSPQAQREIKWINQQMELMEKYYSFSELEDNLVYALENNNPETTNIKIEGR